MPNRFFVMLVIVSDLAAIFLAFFAAYWLRFDSGIAPPAVHHELGWYLPVLLFNLIVLPLLFAGQRMYQLKRSSSRFDELGKILSWVSVGIVITTAASSVLTRDFDFSRLMLALVWACTIVFIWFGRLLQHELRGMLRSRGYAEERLLIVGDGEVARIILAKTQVAPSLGYRVVGYATARERTEEPLDGLPHLGYTDQIAEIVRRHALHEVIVADPPMSHREIIDLISQLDDERVNVKVFPDVFQIMAAEVTIGDFHGLPMLNLRDMALAGWRQGVKRAIDILVSGVILVLLSPLMLAVALLVKLTSPAGPVFYVQERVGINGQVFPVLKFRSMRADAETETGPVWAVRGDPRRTRLGSFLRRLSVDELPQFINVMMGDMSVVGPRPERAYFVEQFSQIVPRYSERLRVKAGLTGWAQVNGLRGNVSVEERTAFDLWYVENWTPWLDIKIMLRTLIAILRDKNAY
jgi:exopolysaccharide biosynthesis polyprenyl glycosylphosphotransferase